MAIACFYPVALMYPLYVLRGRVRAMFRFDSLLQSNVFVSQTASQLLFFFIRTQGTHTNSIVQINKEIIVKINYTKILI